MFLLLGMKAGSIRLDENASTVETLATYIGGQGHLPAKCLGGKGSHNGHFEWDHKDVLILTKTVIACKRIKR